ncbi:MAG: hypothetical protein ACR652_02045 [Methylocystis sp.]|uniref:hypothetical protein n=1 Tax=Methylocystis sp. TaxID=1911079 RepID=UPI003DA6B0F1
MNKPKLFVFALIGVSLLSSLATAQAGPTRARLHVSDFYAHAPEEWAAAPHPSAEAAPATSCYVSLSATEISRGIRHWTNKC